MIGTFTNVGCIAVGSLVGALLRRGFKPEWQDALFDAMGLASLALGANAVCQNMPKSHHPVLFVVSLAVGALVGRVLDIDGRVRRWSASRASGSAVEGITTAALLFCVGTLSILGPINSALSGDNTYLFTNATLDLTSSAVLASAYGLCIIIAAPILFVWQGTIYLVALLFGDVISADLRVELSTVGGVLIMATGLSILKIKDCHTLSLLPSLLVPVVYFLFCG